MIGFHAVIFLSENSTIIHLENSSMLRTLLFRQFRKVHHSLAGPHQLCKSGFSTQESDVVGEISYLDIRVGKVVQIADHPTDAALYVR